MQNTIITVTYNTITANQWTVRLRHKRGQMHWYQLQQVYFYRFKMHTLTHDILKVSQVLLLVLHTIPVPSIKENKQAQKITLFAQCGWRHGQCLSVWVHVNAGIMCCWSRDKWVLFYKCFSLRHNFLNVSYFRNVFI